MTRIPLGQVGSLTTCTSGVLRYPLSNRPLRGGAIFLDRDGVINRRIEDGYVAHLSEFTFLPDALAGLRALARLSRPIVVVSNQAGVAKGIVSTRALEQMTTWFVDEIVAAGGRVDAVYYCPHVPAAECACRKPKPGLLLHAASDFGIDLGRSVTIGDSLSDVEAAIAAGTRAMLISADHQPAAAGPGYEVVPDLRAAAVAIAAT
jgi:D-glycero-D-manno-heptose 1,7-bisphosphate phosphatase